MSPLSNPIIFCFVFFFHFSASVTVNIESLANNLTIDFTSISNEISLSATQIKAIFDLLKAFQRETDRVLTVIPKKVVHFGQHILEGINRIVIELDKTCSAADITALTDIIRQITTDQTNEIIQTLGNQITLNLNELTQSTQTIHSQLTDVQQTLANQLTTIQNNFDQSNQLTDNRITQLEQTINLLEQNLAGLIEQLQINVSAQIVDLTPCK